jgi:spore coat polysaccharide biosynthesis protein SpsF
MKVGAIIQARMSSRRFPGKVLHELYAKPLIEYLLDRVTHCRGLDQIVVATSTDPSDDRVAEFCARKGLEVFRGPLDNVALRFNSILHARDWDAFARICGDSPMLDQSLLELGIRRFKSTECDLVTNVMPRSFPKGQSIEITRARTFMAAFPLIAEPIDLENVTIFFYRERARFQIVNVKHEPDLSAVQMSVDTPEDMAAFERILGAMQKPHWRYGLKELLGLCDNCVINNQAAS